MSAKLLISGLSNSGKTTLTKDLDPKTTLVFSHDGKNYPFALPHVNIGTFGTATELVNVMTEKITAFKDKFGYYPTNVVIDSVSKVFDTLANSMNTKYTGFKVYSELDKEIGILTDFIQNSLIPSDISVILISHATYDSEQGIYNLVGKGSFSKRGGFLSETDNAIFVETKNGKRIVHHRSTKFPSRTVLEDMPDSQGAKEYKLNDHLEKLRALKDKVADFIL